MRMIDSRHQRTVAATAAAVLRAGTRYAVSQVLVFPFGERSRQE
jgi:hypothetical protein